MKWEYSKTWKALAIVINQICAVVLVLSVVVCTVYVGSSGFGWVGKDQSFESTAYYQNEVLEQIYRCIRAASRESKFEKMNFLALNIKGTKIDLDQAVQIAESLGAVYAP